MLAWDNDFFSLLPAAKTPLQTKNVLIEKIKVERKEMVQTALSTDRHTWPEGTELLNMVQAIARFRDNDEKDVLQLAYAVPVSELLDDVEPGDSATVEIGLSIFDEQMSPVFRDVREYTLIDKSDPGIWKDYLIDEFEVSLIPALYNIAVHGQAPEVNRVNGWQYHYSLSDSSRNALSLSTLKPAFDIQPIAGTGGRHRNDLLMVPNPAKIFSRDEPVFAYYEVYHLAYNQEGRTDYSVTFTVKEAANQRLLDRITGIFSSGEECRVSVQSDQTGDSRSAADYISFDMGRVSQGSYELILDVKDKVTGDTAVSKVVIQLK
jgi:hypothetical protein